MKRSVCFLLAAVTAWLLSVGCFAQGGVTVASVPAADAKARLLWSVKLGSNYRNAPSPAAVKDGFVYVMCSDRLLKLDAASGEEICSARLASPPSFGTVPPLVTESGVYCPLDGGRVQAFEPGTLKPVWSSVSACGGAAMTPITEYNSRIYTGFWVDDEKSAEFCCFDCRTGSLKWKISRDGGFYWAECAAESGKIVLGGDNGSTEADAPGELLCLDAESGKALDSVEIVGDMRSGAVIYNGFVFAATKAGRLYKIPFNAESGHFGSPGCLTLAGAVTSTPVTVNGRLYAGVCAAGGEIDVIDAKKLCVIYRVKAEGNPQSRVLAAGNAESGGVTVFFTCNSLPGGIYAFEDLPGKTGAQANCIFEPESGCTGYCISPVTADENGTLFYKNDSGVLFAVAAAKKNGLLGFLIEFIKTIVNIIFTAFGAK